MIEKKYFPFYWNWAEMINDFTDKDNDIETAKLLAWAIIRYASTGKIEDLGNRYLQRMFESCLTVGLDSARNNYETGTKGGRPPKLTEEDHRIIALRKTQGESAKSIAQSFCVSDDTIRRADGWKNPQNYTQNYMQNAKPYAPQKQNQEEEEKEEEKEEKEEEGKIAYTDIDQLIGEVDLSQVKVDPESDTTPTPGFEKYSPDEIRNFRRLGFVI